MSILFITSSRLGDAVLSTGVLEFSCRTLPEAPVVVACSSLVMPLFEDWPRLERMIEIRRKPFSWHWISLWQETVKQPWEWVIDVRGSTLSYFLWSKKRSMWRSISSPHHRVEQLGQVFKLPHSPSPVLHVSAERQERLQHILPFSRPVIAVAPAANWQGKEWPQKNFIVLLQQLTSAQGLFPDARVAFFAAPAERERVQSLLEAFPEDRVLDFVGKLPFLDIHVLFQKCCFFIGNDSGLMHLAAASGVPTLGLFGPSPEIHYAPYGSCAAYVRTPESYETLMTRFRKTGEKNLMDSLSIEKVEEAVHSLWQRVQKETV